MNLNLKTGMHRKNILAHAIVMATMTLLIPVPGRADQIISGGSGITNPEHTVTFSEVSLTSGAVLTNQLAAYGVTFSGAYYDPQNVFFATPSIGNYSLCCGGVHNPVSIIFDAIVTDSAFQFITNSSPPDSTFQAYLQGSLVDSFTAFTNFSQDWFGFTGLAFDEIRVSAGGTGGVFLLDNLQFSSNTPEPAALALLCSGLAGLSIIRRKGK